MDLSSLSYRCTDTVRSCLANTLTIPETPICGFFKLTHGSTALIHILARWIEHGSARFFGRDSIRARTAPGILLDYAIRPAQTVLEVEECLHRRVSPKYRRKKLFSFFTMLAKGPVHFR